MRDNMVMDKNAQYTLRLPQAMKEQMMAAARAQDIDTMTWLRHAIREKLDRELAGGMDEKSLEESVRRVVLKLKNENVI